MRCDQSDGEPAALCVHSSDDYYEYGHSGESYDSYGEFLLLQHKHLNISVHSVCLGRPDCTWTFAR